MFTHVKIQSIAVLFMTVWMFTGCAQDSQISTPSTGSAAAVNVLAGTSWTECHWILSVGQQHYFNKRAFDFTADGRMTVRPLAFYNESACKAEISTAEVKKAFGRMTMPTGGYEHRYNVASGPDADGVYDFDLIVYSQTTYTSMKIEGDHLMIGSAFNADTEDPKELAMTGVSPQTRAYAIDQLPLYYSLYRLP